MKMIVGWCTSLRDGLCRLMEVIACSTLIIILGMVVVEVVARSLFGISHSYLVELPRLFIAYITFLYVAMGLKLDSHIKASLIPEGLNPLFRKVVSLVVHLLIAYAIYLMLRTGISLVKLHLNTGAATYTAVPIPVWIFSISCPIGLGLAFFLSVDMVIQDIVSLKASCRK